MLVSAPYEYEYHTMRDSALPLFYHEEHFKAGYRILTHWHENPELLCFTRGRGTAVLDGVPIDVETGDMICINSGSLHQVIAAEDISYYCLIIDKSFCLRCGIPVNKVRLQTRINDAALREYYEQLVRELETQAPCYQAAVQANCLLLLTRLYRNYPDRTPQQNAVSLQSGQLSMVRNAIQFINQSYQRPLTIDEICREVGSSKFHFCRVFRMITGKTVIDHLNFLRCEKAQYLLSTGACNVQEAAEHCGFNSSSYFSVVYKRQIGEVPSTTCKRAAANRDHTQS
ncbi:MAG: AraC family transcriptional regulator [Oscillospiraceae bacterium]|nr:AraC family transcriptional regulator [Oscillospiraceae bacterium]